MSMRVSEQASRPFHVDELEMLVTSAGIIEGCSEMADAVDAARLVADCSNVEQVAIDECDPSRFQSGAPAGVIARSAKRYDFVARRQGMLDEMTADESAGTADEYAHEVLRPGGRAPV